MGHMEARSAPAADRQMDMFRRIVAQPTITCGRRAISAAAFTEFERAWFNPKRSSKECAKIIGVPVGSLYATAKQLGLGLRHNRTAIAPSRVWTDVEDGELRRDVEAVSRASLAERYGVCGKTLRLRLQHLGIDHLRYERPRAVRTEAKSQPNANTGFLTPRAPKVPRKFTAEIRTDVPIRKFEMGASAMGFDNMLRDEGYSVISSGHIFHVKRAGERKPRKLTQKQLIALLDECRVRKGLQPIMKR